MNVFSQLLNYLRQSRLSRRLLAYVLFCSTVFTLLATAIQLYYYYRSDVHTIEETLQFVEASYAPAIATNVYSVDDEEVRLQLKGVLLVPDITYAEVTEKRGTHLFSISAGHLDPEADIQREYPLTYHHPSGRIVDCGTMRLAASLAGVYQRTWSKALVILVTNALKTLIAATVILMIFHFTITRHLVAMAHHAEHVNGHHLSTHLTLNRAAKPSSSDELDQVVASWNAMQERIESNIIARREDAKQLRQRIREITALGTVSRQVSSSLSVTQVANAAIKGIADAVEPDMALLFVRNGDDLTLEGLLATNPQYDHDRIPIHKVGQCLCGLAVKSGRPIYTVDISNDPRCTWHECKDAGLRSFAAIPLNGQSGTFGVLGLATATPRDFQLQSTFLEALADEIAIGLQNAMLYEEVDKKRAELAAVNRRLREEVAERERAEKWLRFTQYAVDNAGEVAFWARHDRQILYANHAASQLLGYRREELVGMNFDDILLDVSDEQKQALWKRLKTHGTITFETTNRTRDGRHLPVEITASLVNFGGEEYFCTFLRNITLRKAAEEQRERLIENLATQNAELERFAYTVSHDLRTPLISIKWLLGMLEEDLPEDTTSKAQDDIRRISRAADTMGELLADVLELSRVGRVVNPPESISMVDLANEVLDAVANHTTQRGIRTTVAPDMPCVFGDRVRLREVLQNLLENAIKYMGDQPEPCIEIGSRQDEDTTVFFVRDNGIGIDRRYQDKVFGLFDQLDKASEGSGVGLALAKRIVEVHGGKIWVESEGAGHGSTFFFTIAKQNE